MKDEVKQQLLEALAKAIQAEVEGYHFYKMAASTTADAHGKQVFEDLAREEQQHAEWLRAQYRSLDEHDSLDAEAEFGAAIHDPQSPIFSESLKARAATAHFEMTALSVGVQLEADAQKHYKMMAELADDDEVKALFRRLADWESGHYHTLLAQLDALKEDYWAANRFAPF